MSLVGVAEIAEMLGVSKQVVGNWRSRKSGFPTPVATLRASPVWAEAAMLQWAEFSHSDSYPAGSRQGKPIFMTDNARSARKDALERAADEFLRRVGR